MVFGLVFLVEEFPQQSVTVKETFWSKGGESRGDAEEERGEINLMSLSYLLVNSETDKQTASRYRFIMQQCSLIWAPSASYCIGPKIILLPLPSLSNSFSSFVPYFSCAPVLFPSLSFNHTDTLSFCILHLWLSIHNQKKDWRHNILTMWISFYDCTILLPFVLLLNWN